MFIVYKYPFHPARRDCTMQTAQPVRALVLAGGGAKGSYQIGV